MSREDVVELPVSVPHKRRQLEAALDLHIAMWLDSEILTPSERRRLEAEKARRKALVPDSPVGLLVAHEGATPAQLAALPGALRGATEIHHPGVASNVHSACRATAQTRVHREPGAMAMRQVILASSRVVALVKETAIQTHATPGVWQAIGLARHRSIPVTVIGPDGNHLQEDV